MCGISGFLIPNGLRREEAQTHIRGMVNSLTHRGPDDYGEWIDSNMGVALGHRRLSILDLSSAGHQPMVSPSGRYIMVFNGEIYNHLDIRKNTSIAKMYGASWRGHSDSETLLAAIEHWGIKKAVSESVGMFALALWDREKRELSLARDRMGEKPLYYGWQGKVFLFGSELKSLRASPAFESELNREALPDYFRYGYIPAPLSIWRGILKLLPGAIVKIKIDVIGDYSVPDQYWSLSEEISNARNSIFDGSDAEAIKCLDSQLRDTVSSQMMADVPLGTFLSGGIDSSIVTSIMQSQSSRPINTFTIGFDDTAYNEANYAKAIAQHLGTNHTELYATSEMARDVIPSLPSMYDEPFGDSSAIPTFLVSKLARKSVAVALSGDGGDELFGGYNRYLNDRAEKAWRLTRMSPMVSRHLLKLILHSGVLQIADKIIHASSRIGGRKKSKFLHAKVSSLSAVSTCESHEAFYRMMISQWQQPPTKSISTTNGKALKSLTLSDTPNTSPEKMMEIDALTYLPDDILTKVDRAAMSVSLETRVPLLDHRLVELSCRIPYKMKVRNGQGKWLLRQVLKNYVPNELIDQPKRGFAVPVDGWMRGPLREWCEDLLSASRLSDQGILEPGLIRNRWDQHIRNEYNWRDSLWFVLMFQAWRQKENVK